MEKQLSNDYFSHTLLFIKKWEKCLKPKVLVLENPAPTSASPSLVVVPSLGAEKAEIFAFELLIETVG